MAFTKLAQTFDYLKDKPKKKLVAVYANDDHTICAVNDAVNLGIIEGVLVGNKAEIEKVCLKEKIEIEKFTIIQESDELKAALHACDLINAGEGDFIMKGLLSTDKYMRAILNKERGLMNKNAVLSHVTVFEIPSYHKLIIAGDVAIIPAPDLNQKIAITNYLIDTAHALGIEQPKVGLLAASEQTLPKMQACVDAAVIAKMSERNQIKNALVDGPLAFDLMVDPESVKIKKLVSPVAGDVDCILFPNIESGNVFYKSMTRFAGAELGALVVGARVPAILSSRGDSIQTKMYSIALGATLAFLKK
jgi:phosphate butyryltransferase